MPIVAAAVVPHSPLLLPSIAKNHAARSTALLTSLQTLGQELYAYQPDTVVFLTPHGHTAPGTSTIEVAEILTGKLIDFGDIRTELTVRGALGLSHRLKEAAEDADVPLNLQTSYGLDYGVTVPWTTMWSEDMPWTALPLNVHGGSAESLIRLGDVVREFFQSSPERVVLVASGDATRRRNTMTDSDRRPTPDERLLGEAIAQVDARQLGSIAPESMCLRDPLVVLLSSLNGLSFRGTLRHFDVPITVGQVIADFQQQ